MSLVEHARKELDLIQEGADLNEGERDLFQQEINEHLLAMVALFAETGHSGGSAGYAIDMLQKLLAWEPILPLYGTPDEWMDVTYPGDEGGFLEQNVRCSHVFRQDGIPYDIEAVIFRERGGATFQNGRDSARRVTFPYRPRSKTVPAWQRRPRMLIARALRRHRP